LRGGQAPPAGDSVAAIHGSGTLLAGGGRSLGHGGAIARGLVSEGG
jgi:hypothetical protein